MAQKYVGRHRPGANGAARGGRRLAAAVRPVVRGGATVALAGAAVSGYLVAAPTAAPQAGAAAAAQVDSGAQRLTLAALDASLPAIGADHSAARADAAELVQSRLATAQRLAAKVQADAAGAQATATADAQALAAAEAQRQAEAERAARDAQRAAALAGAQANPKAAAQALVEQRGWNDAQFQCLVKLWTKESNWNYKATNRSSGAYGIPQSLPGSKMAAAGADWRTNPLTQITWGLDYIKGVYGSPCSAWAHSQRTNWY